MKLLFDDGTPAPLRRHLGDHVIHTAARMGWANLRNGDLLDRVEENGYEVLITTDQNIRYGLNLTGRTIGTVVPMNPRWPFVRLCTVAVREALYKSGPERPGKSQFPLTGAGKGRGAP